MLELLQDLFELVPVCPEMAIGLGVPRRPIQLATGPSGLRVVEVAGGRREYTQALRTAGARFLEEWPGLCGLVVKSRSPSCALRDAPVMPDTGRTAPGMFVQAVMATRPWLPAVDEREAARGVPLLRFVVGVLGCRRALREGAPPAGGPCAGGAAPASGKGCSAQALAEVLLDEMARPDSGLSAQGRARLRAWLRGHGYTPGRC